MHHDGYVAQIQSQQSKLSPALPGLKIASPSKVIDNTEANLQDSILYETIMQCVLRIVDSYLHLLYLGFYPFDCKC